ncbi:TPA: hypothetical protein EYO12_03175 [Candidatus Saccharibacteria bacterium]|nr:hypothetical protein [Candidatus Saccharibacteria bacterium]HIO87964.1 hypothetical protein [Candidatus Saccharibacteria bacterium]
MSKKVKITIIALLIAIVAGVGLFLVMTKLVKHENVSEPTNGELNIQLGLHKSIYSIGESITFKSFINNPTTSAKTYTFSSTCTEGTFYINEQPIGLYYACGDALTDINIGSNKTITYEYPFTLVDDFSHDISSDYIGFSDELKLPPGEHQAKLQWQGFESNILTFNVE